MLSEVTALINSVNYLKRKENGFSKEISPHVTLQLGRIMDVEYHFIFTMQGIQLTHRIPCLPL